MKFSKAISIIALFIILPLELLAQECRVDESSRKEILKLISLGDVDILNKLAPCYSLDRKLIVQASLLDYKQFNNAHEILKKDESFINHLIKVSPEILQFIDKKLLSDENFMEQATYFYRDSLKYANPSLLDNRLFMSKMIDLDSRNYIFASEKIKSDPQLAKIAFSDNGNLLSYAPKSIKSDKELVKTAMLSSSSALDYAEPALREDKELKKLSANEKKVIIDEYILRKFLEKNYTTKENKKNLGFKIANQANLAKQNIIINRNYITKWQTDFAINNNQKYENLKLSSYNKNNYAPNWKDDFKKYPELINKIEQFFLKHHIDQNTIDSLSTTYLWKVKEQPLTYVLNLYLMRDTMVKELDSNFSNITSLTAIVQQYNKNWKLTVVEVIFDSEIKVDIAYNNGHKRYIVWDLIDKDHNPKILFKVEDKFNNYFEIFTEENSGKYKMSSKIEIDLKKIRKN